MMMTESTKGVAVTQQIGIETAMRGIIVAATMTIVMTGTMTGEGEDLGPPVDAAEGLALGVFTSKLLDRIQD